jgi:hypothetical protein
MRDVLALWGIMSVDAEVWNIVSNGPLPIQSDALLPKV